MVVVILSAFKARAGEKIFHYLFTISLFASSVAYFTMASDLGYDPVEAYHDRSAKDTHQIFYAMYLNWVVGWPPVIIAVCLVSGISWATIIYNIVLAWAWVFSWLFSAVTSSTYKWGYFTFGTFAYFLLAISILGEDIRSGNRYSTGRQYQLISVYLVFIWLLYPIAFGIADGGNLISVTGGAVFFGVLDLLAVPFLAGVMLCLSRAWDYEQLNIKFTQTGRVHGSGPLSVQKGGPKRKKAKEFISIMTLYLPDNQVFPELGLDVDWSAIMVTDWQVSPSLQSSSIDSWSLEIPPSADSLSIEQTPALGDGKGRNTNLEESNTCPPIKLSVPPRIERRRAQNRDAQRLFRQKQKVRMESLEDKLIKVTGDYSRLLQHYEELERLYETLLRGQCTDVILHAERWQQLRVQALQSLQGFENCDESESKKNLGNISADDGCWQMRMIENEQQGASDGNESSDGAS
ncbi:hypothetical protein VTL71DRAFT_6209 [Oculimacula yallundae]|uniref:BZIP domain-containing protein n=1 Tax=Oculimacula yallundae TaxID=86028 RepID=A0ABR4C0P1_9HELO